MVTKLQEIDLSKDKQIQMFENKIDQLEQYTRKENIIIIGLKTNHKSWSRRVASNDASSDGENAPQEEIETESSDWLLEHKPKLYHESL